MDTETLNTMQSVDAKRHLEQAYVSEENEDLENALRECELSIQLDANCAESHNLRGIILDELGRNEEALVAYREAVRLDPTFSDAQENLLELETELRGGQSREAALTTVEGKKFGVRTAAYGIDAVAYYVLDIAAGFVGGLVLSIVLVLSRRISYLDQQALQVPNCLSALVLFVLYFAVFEWLYGATLGKLALGMRVIQKNGEPCSFGSAVLRGLLRYIDGFFFAIPAYASMKHPLYQRIGDRAADTIVVGSNDPIIQQPRAGWWFIVAAAVYFALNVFTKALVLNMAVR